MSAATGNTPALTPVKRDARWPWVVGALLLGLVYLRLELSRDLSFLSFWVLYGLGIVLFDCLWASDSNGLRWWKTLPWLLVPAVASFVFECAPSPALAMMLPILGLVTGSAVAWTTGRALRSNAPESVAQRVPRLAIVWIVLFLVYAGYLVRHPEPSPSRTHWGESTGQRAQAEPIAFERTEKLRLGPTQALEIPSTFSGCEVTLRVVTAWNVVLEVAFSEPAGLERTSFFVGTDPRIKTGFARQDDPDSAVEPIGVLGWARQPYQRLDITLRRADGRLVAFVVDRSDSPESQRKQEESAVAWAEVDTGRAVSISLLAAKGVFDVERVSVSPMESQVSVVEAPLTWRSRSVILPLAIVLLAISFVMPGRNARMRWVNAGSICLVFAIMLRDLLGPPPASLLLLAERSMYFGVLFGFCASLPLALGSRSLLPTLAAVLGGILAIGAYLYAPELVEGRSRVRFGSLHDWRGRSFEPDLAFLRHPALRGRQRYYTDHTFHGEVAAPLRLPDALRVVIVGPESRLLRFRDQEAPLSKHLETFLLAYAAIGPTGALKSIECLDGTAPSESNLAAIQFCEQTLLARVNPQEDAAGKPWNGPDVEALAPDWIVFLVSFDDPIDGSLELLESNVGPSAFRTWGHELREECDLGKSDSASRLRARVKAVIELAGTVSVARNRTGRACRLSFLLPPRKAIDGAVPFVRSFDLFDVFAPVLPESAGEGKNCFDADGNLTAEGQRLLARMLALWIAPQLPRASQ